MTVSALPLQLDLTIYAGTDFTRTFRWLPDGTNPQDFTGWTGLFLLGPAGGTAEQQRPVTLTNDGYITITLDAADTNGLLGGALIYQVDLTDATGKIMRFLRGRTTVVRDLTGQTP